MSDSGAAIEATALQVAFEQARKPLSAPLRPVTDQTHKFRRGGVIGLDPCRDQQAGQTFHNRRLNNRPRDKLWRQHVSKRLVMACAQMPFNDPPELQRNVAIFVVIRAGEQGVDDRQGVGSLVWQRLERLDAS